MRDNKYSKVFGLSIVLILISIGVPIIVIGYISSSDNSNQEIVYDTGEIIYLSFEGGFFGIVTDEGIHYDPINLPSEFEIDGLRIRFIGEKLDLYSFHMWGIIIRIIFIEKLGN
jgi:hypothetical protein